MKKNTRTRKILICFGLIYSFISCKSSLNYFDDYSRDGKKLTHLKKSYQKIDSFDMLEIKLCKNKEIPILAHTDGAIYFSSKSTRKKLINSIENHFGKINHNEQSINSLSWDCGNLTAKEFRNNKNEFEKSDIRSQQNYVKVTFQLNYLTRKNIDYGAAFESSADIGNDIHKVKYKLVLALFKNGDLEYMYNQAHWTKIFSERGQKLNYEIPQRVIDSLMSLSLQEYYARLE